MNTEIPRSIIDMLSENVYWLDKDGRILGCNRNQALMFGYDSPNELLGKTIFDVAKRMNWPHSVAESVHANNIQIMETRDSSMFEESGFWGGEEHFMLSYKYPWMNEKKEVVGLVGISVEITQRKKFEIALNEAKNKAEVANRAKTEFLNNLSHDLRTPLSSLVSLNKYIVEKTQDTPIHSFAVDAQTCSEQVLFLIDEILEVTEIEDGRISTKLQSFRLPELFKSIQKLMMPAVRKKNLTFSINHDTNIPETILSNCQLLHRILMNLIANAIKFTHQGEVKLISQLVDQNSNKATIKLIVQDTGIGIDKSDHQRIFERFERLTPSFEGTYSGRGLGLYIVKKFAEILFAEIDIKSAINQGTKVSLIFDVTIPDYMDDPYEPLKIINNNAEKKLNSLSKSFLNTNSRNRHKQAEILLVEDTQMAQIATKIALQPHCGYIGIVEMGLQALTAYKNRNYDIIMLDIGLPDISGLEVAKRIREYELQSNKTPTPIIALTAHLNSHDYHQAYAHGIQQVLQKPLAASQAEIVLKNWLPKFYKAHNNKDNLIHSIKKVIDIDESEKVMGSKTLAKSILEEFITTLPDEAKKIKNAFTKKDYKKLRKIIHALNGCSSYAGTPSLKKACNSLEAAIDDQFNDNEIIELFNDVCSEIDKILHVYASEEHNL